jgi:hypothetical protein
MSQHSLFVLAALPYQKISDRSKVVTLAFLRPSPDDYDSARDYCTNRLTACFSRHGFCHVELVFDGGMAFSIYDNGAGAALRARTLSNPNYELVPLSVTGAEYRACLQFCSNLSQKAVGFDSLGMYCAPLRAGLPCGLCACFERTSERAGKTFCSKVIVEAMQFAGVPEVDGLTPSAATPSSLYAAVRASERRVCDSVRVSRPGGIQLALQTF